MKGNVAASIDFVNLDPPGGEQRARGYDVIRTRVAAQGDDRRVLDKEEHVRDALLLAQLNQHLLQTERRAVIDNAEMEDSDRIHQAPRPGTERSGSARAA